jgi:hypothetical protein
LGTRFVGGGESFGVAGHRSWVLASCGAGEVLMVGLDESPRWRVFVSHTSELREYPKGESYVAAVERAVLAQGHVVVDKADFPAVEEAPAQMCVEKVKGCDVYVGVLGARYGSPVLDRPEVSYSELEFETATEAGMDRLVFVLDYEADDLGIPAKALDDREFGARQDRFRKRVMDSGLTSQRFKNPFELGQLVERSLRELATKARIDSGIERERQPAAPKPVRASKFVNPPPMTAPTWFQGRRVETRLMAEFLADPGMRMMTVVGQGGTGKSAIVCRLLKGLEAGRIPDVDSDLAGLGVNGIVYLSPNGRHPVDYLNLVGDLCRLLPAEAAKDVLSMREDPHNTPEQVVSALLEQLPAGNPVVVYLDSLESVMDAESESLIDPALHEALATVLSASEHAVKVIITTRVTPNGLMSVQSAVQQRLTLDGGLGSPDAEHVLRSLDPDGTLGLRDAPEDLLRAVKEATHGFPRALEAVKATLVTDPTRSVEDVLNTIRGAGEKDVVEVLFGDAYERLDDPTAQQVILALAMCPSPVSEVGVDYLLQPYDPTIDSAPVLARLAGQLVRHDNEGQFYLNRADKTFALGQIPAGQGGDTPPVFTREALKARVLDYYFKIRPGNYPATRDDARTWLVHDQPATVDGLGRKALAGEIAALLERLASDDNRPEAFAVHLDAPWGAGKSTLVGFIADDLRQATPPWLTVQLDAWRSSQLSPAWWALLSHLRSGVRNSLDQPARLYFDIRWFAHEVLRIWRYWLPLGVFFAILLVVGLASQSGDFIASAPTISAVIALIVTVAALGNRFLSLGSMQGARIHERLNENPMDDVAHQFRWLRARTDKPVLLVLDDIDRCNERFAVELLDAIQTLMRNPDAERLRGRHPQALVVLAVGDHRWLEAAYEDAYQIFSRRVGEPGRPLGRLFLDKLFQLNIGLPKSARG